MSTAAAQSQKPAAFQHSDGWFARLNCRFEAGPEKTIVRRSHQGPLCIQRPLYPEGATAHVYMLHPPSGVVGGDVLDVQMSVAEAAHGLVSTPGATRFYRSEGPVARVAQRLEIKAGSMEWLPAENIFFAGSNSILKTTIELSADASLAWWEINCFGQHALQKPFTQGCVSSTMDLVIDGKPTLRERLEVSDDFPIRMSCGLRNNSVTATFLMTPMPESSIDFARSQIAQDKLFVATWFDSLLLIRYLGESAEEARAGFIRVWSGLRQALNQTPPMLPRIWAT